MIIRQRFHHSRMGMWGYISGFFDNLSISELGAYCNRYNGKNIIRKILYYFTKLSGAIITPGRVLCLTYVAFGKFVMAPHSRAINIDLQAIIFCQIPLKK